MTGTSTSKADSDTLSDASPRNVGSDGAADEHVCPACHGAGFVHPVSPNGAVDYSRVVPCHCQAPLLERERKGWLQRYSNLGYLAHHTFESARKGGRGANSGGYAAAYDAAREFAESPGGWLVLVGPLGCGKTRLACAIANERIAHGRSVFYVSTPDLLDHLRGTYSPGSEIRYDELFEQVRNAPLLILDDVELEGSTPWAREKLEQILNHRFNLKLPTVLATDVSPDDMDERLGARLAQSELSRVCVLGKPRGNGLDVPELPEGLREHTFENFDYLRVELPQEERQNLEMAYVLAKEFAEQPEGWIVFQGLNGCGKTHLAAAIANHRIALQEPVLFLVVSDLLDYLRSAFGPESRISYSKSFEEIKKHPLLILDDYGEQGSTPWARSKLFQLMNYRYNARLPMVLTTALALDDIEPRVIARLADPRVGTVFNIMAPHYNLDVYERRNERSS